MLSRHWAVATPSFTQFGGIFDNLLMEDELFYQCGCCLEKCYIILEQYGPGGYPMLAPMPQIPPPGVYYPAPAPPAALPVLNIDDIAAVIQDIEDGILEPEVVDLVSDDEQD
ncbi:uncharacterized protein LOC127750610 [Frankliniella occidentalis]|uniref:Uncharacterized protein LOC127750610 n=1 Tax=Frankliniella occidentalis TaxID=133901 RepID=A0A9C6X3X9_FRAOC|nr:uncharacterized protein LOC127750610 [Frankliniella occidentalis]